MLFLDTAIFMHAAGREHALREPCRTILERVAGGKLEAITSAEVVQEILQRFVGRGDRDVGVAMARSVLALCDPVLPISHGVMRRMPDLVGRYPNVAARDLVHLATCLEEGLVGIVSPDTGFDAVTEIPRLDPVVLGA